ncbi:MAG: hypothetical protein ACTSXY_15140 [Promethearchaeota archaeon]
MINFLDFSKNCNESLDFENVPPKQKKEVSLFLGRFQPIHIGHQIILKKMKNPLVVLIKGTKTSRNSKRNPFTQEYQLGLLKTIMPNLKIHTVPSGFLPLILFDIRRLGFEPIKVYAGADRLNSYKKMISSFPDELGFNIKFVKTPRICSATEVRKAIKSNNFKSFKENMPKKLWTEWETMKTILKEK